MSAENDRVPLNSNRNIFIFSRFFLLGILLGLFPKLGLAETSLSPEKSSEKDLLEINLLDVGQGESILISCPDRHTHWLMDSGTTDELYWGGEKKFISSFEAVLRNIAPNSKTSDKTNLNLLITHTDPDHWGGLKYLLTNHSSKIRSIFMKGDPAELSSLAGLSSRARPFPSSISLCPDSKSPVRLKLIELSETGRQALGCPKNLNDCSAVSTLEYKDFRMLLMADGTTRLEKALLLESKVPTAQVLKVGHHASSSSSKAFLRAAKPSLALYSSGVRLERPSSVDKWGYPRTTDIENLNNFFARKFPKEPPHLKKVQVCNFSEDSCIWGPVAIHHRILPTSLLGTIRLQTDGTRLWGQGKLVEIVD